MKLFSHCKDGRHQDGNADTSSNIIQIYILNPVRCEMFVKLFPDDLLVSFISTLASIELMRPLLRVHYTSTSS